MKTSGTAVFAMSLILVSGFLAWCGIKNRNPLQAAKSLAQGKNPATDTDVKPISGAPVAIWVDPSQKAT